MRLLNIFIFKKLLVGMQEYNLDEPIFGDFTTSEQMSFNSNLKDSKLKSTVDTFLTKSQLEKNQEKPKKVHGRFSERPATKSNHFQFLNNFCNRSSHNENNSQFQTESQRSEEIKSKYFQEEIKVGDIRSQDTFECSQCKGKECKLCGGQKVLMGDNNVIKFFSYIMDFKVSKTQSYERQKKKVNFGKNNVNNFISQHYQSSSSLMTESINLNQLTKTMISSSRISKQECSQKLSMTKSVHCNYECDQCKAQPIIGERFHCNICEDYDLCEDCFILNRHEHDMEKIEKCGFKRQVEGITSMLFTSMASENNSKKSSLKPPPKMMNEMMCSKVYRSNIR